MTNYKLKSKPIKSGGYLITLHKGFLTIKSWYNADPVITERTTNREYNILVDSYTELYRMETEGLSELNSAELLTSYEERLAYVGSGKLKDCMKHPYWLREAMTEFLERKWDVPTVGFNYMCEMFESENRYASFEQVLEMMEGK